MAFNDYIYDLETYPNFFSNTILRVDTGELWAFEISDRVNHSDAMRSFLMALSHDPTARMVGYNNTGFDYPVLHHGLQYPEMNATVFYTKAQQIIDGDWNNRFAHMIWDSDMIIPQIDLFKIHHFDNFARSTSLKVLECNMKSENVADLPFPPGTVLTPEQMGIVLEYNKHDIMETWRFYNASKERIEFREELSEKYGRNFMNHNDTKIGKDYFIMKLNEMGIATKGPDRQPIQTLRTRMPLADAVLPWIKFQEPEFNRILDWFKSQTIVNTKGVFDDINCTVKDFTFDFGLGGIHGSVNNRSLSSDLTHVILDLDVTSYYPKLAITNRFYPEHLGEQFCDIYEDVFEQRISYPKGTVENAMLKLALNGVYGDSNNGYSPFYDSLYTMKVTINGQLLLCLLAERLMALGELEMIQINTDGLTIRIPRTMKEIVKQVCDTWENETKLNLEENEYSRMWIRDVNNYIAEYVSGDLKRKGAYGYGPDLDWNQNHGQQVVAKAAEAHLVHGESVRRFIESHTDLHDFFLNTKVPRNSNLILVDDDGNETLQHNVTRYYVSKEGGSLIKCMPPLPKKPDVWRRIGIKVGHKVWPCNRFADATAKVNYEYYIIEAEKLCLKS